MEISEDLQRAGAQLFQVEPSSFNSLHGSDGAVYTCQNGEASFVIKFVPMKSTLIPRVEEKLAFIDFLAGRGLRVSRPLPSIHGRILERLEADGQNYVVSISAKVAGEHMWGKEHPLRGPDYYSAWGQVLGKMHAAAKEYPFWRLEISDEAVDAIQVAADVPHIMDWRIEHKDFYQWSQEPEIKAAWMQLKTDLLSLPITRDCYGLIHNDAHEGNFLVQDGKITLLDFDVCTYHWFMTDLGIVAYHSLFSCPDQTPDGRSRYLGSFMTHFRRGYEAENTLDETWWQKLDLFMRYRRNLLYIVFRSTWPADLSAKQRGTLDRLKEDIIKGEPVVYL